MKLSLIKKISSKKGFTLIELLVVIAVLGVLAVATVAAINPTSKVNQAKDANLKSDVSQVANAIQAYYTTNQAYPADTTALVPEELVVYPSSVTYVINTDGTAAAAYAASNETAGSFICWDTTITSVITTATEPILTAPSC